MNLCRPFLASVVLVLLSAGVTLAKAPPLTPGKFKDWDGKVDDLEIVQPFHLRDYQKILVLPIDASGIHAPDDDTQKAVNKTLAKSTAVIAEEFDSGIPNKMRVKVQPAPSAVAPTPGVMILRAKFVEMDAGNRWARLFSKGYGGASHVTVTGEFSDAVTGKVLLRFTHHNYHSGGASYTGILEENEEQVAGVLAHLVKAFYP